MNNSESLHDDDAEDGAEGDCGGDDGDEESGDDLLVFLCARLGPEHHGHVDDVAVGEGEDEHERREAPVGVDDDGEGAVGRRQVARHHQRHAHHPQTDEQQQSHLRWFELQGDHSGR